ncbi:MAG: PD-(D/E)XK nuclease family protein [Coriobacteriales bacterium]|jgi:RecB family exonuclease|nr:PD-(D/E)XK nuclease family protein [Coriobacteriales bacterium]
MGLVERIVELKREQPLRPVRVLVPNRGTAGALQRELCAALGSFAALEFCQLPDFLAENFEPCGRRLLTDTQRVIALLKVLRDERGGIERQAPQLYRLRQNFALIAKLNATCKQLEYLTPDDVARLLAAPDISDTFRQCLQVFARARAVYAGDYYEKGELYHTACTPRLNDTLFTCNLASAPRQLCIRAALDGIVPPQNHYDEALGAKVAAAVTKLSDPATECVWAAQKVIQTLRDPSIKPADIAITFAADRGYSMALKLALDEAGIANRLRFTLPLKTSSLFRDLLESPEGALAEYLAGAIARPTPSEDLSPLKRRASARYNDLLDSLEQFRQADVALTPLQLRAYIETFYLGQSITLDPATAGEISIAPIGELVGHSYRQLIVLGLSETIAPVTFKQDSLISFRDIETIRALSDKDPLPTLAESIELQQRQFHLLAQKAGAVHLSVPAQTSKGMELIESRWLGACIEFNQGELEKIPTNRRKLIEHTDGSERGDADLLSIRYFETKYDLRDAIVIANRRLCASRRRCTFDSYNGNIGHLGLRGFFSHWSASAFELYARNPFDFFMRNVLGLQEPGEDAAALAFNELSAMDFGTFLHECLERLTKLCVKHGELDAADIEATIHSIMADIPRDHLDWQENYPEIFALLQNGQVKEVLEQQLSDQVQDARAKLSRWSAHLRQEIEGYRVATEASFCTKDGSGKELALLDGRRIMLDGRIDRIDHNRSTGQKRVIDYKTGAPKDIDLGDLTAANKQSGRRFQLQLYALLVSETKDFADVEKAEYQYFKCEDAPQARTATQEALAQCNELTLAYLTAMTAGIEAGLFPYKASRYGSPFLRQALEQENDRNRLSRVLHRPYLRALEALVPGADQALATRVLAALAADEPEGR